MDSILHDFGISPVLLAAQVVNFLVLLFLLKKFLYKPLLKALEIRKQKIAESLKQAAEIEERLAKIEQDREKTLEKASQEAKKIIDDSQKSATLIIEEAHQKAKSDMELIVKKGQEQINLDREKMQQELKVEMAELVAEGLKVVAGKVLSEKDKKEIVEKSLKNLN